MEGKLNIPSSLDHIKMIAELGEKNRKLSGSKLGAFKKDLKVLGVSLSILYQAATCHRKCFGGPHIFESLAGRSYNLASSAYILICRGFYDEALNLVRSMGEVANLIGLSVVDKDALRKWISADKKTRLREFSPAKVRGLLEGEHEQLLFANKDWYSKFCEDYTHVHPKTKPNAHGDSDQSHIGGFIQEEGMKFSVNELTNVCAHIAMLVSKYFDLDDMFDELCEAIRNSD